MFNWLVMKFSTLKKKCESDVNVVAVENLVELACGGVTVTTEGKGCSV